MSVFAPIIPCLILATYKWLDKFEHRPFVPSFLASNSNSFSYGASKIFNEKTKTGADTGKIEKALYPMLMQ